MLRHSKKFGPPISAGYMTRAKHLPSLGPGGGKTLRDNLARSNQNDAHQMISIFTRLHTEKCAF